LSQPYSDAWPNRWRLASQRPACACRVAAVDSFKEPHRDATPEFFQNPTLASNPTIYSTPPPLSSSLLSSSSVKRAAAMASRLLQIANKACRASRAAAVAASRAASLASRSARAAAADAARISAALDPESCPKTKPREAVTKLPAFPTMITFAAPHSSNCQVNQSSFFLHLINSLCLCNSLCVSYYM
jgi:hypothetical protein